jgi:hypothetical protein
MKLRRALLTALAAISLISGVAIAAQRPRDPSLEKLQPALQPTPIRDQTPPTTTLSRTGPTFAHEDALWVSATTVHRLAAEDNVDPPEDILTFFRFYRAAAEIAPDFRPYTAPFSLTGPDGRYRIEYFSRDTAGNDEPIRLTVEHLDTRAPQITWSPGMPLYLDDLGQPWITSDTPHTLVAEDPAASDGTPGSGINTILYRVYPIGEPSDFSIYQEPFTVSGADGEYSLDFFGSDNVGNVSQIQQERLFLDNTAPSADAGGPYRGTEGITMTFDATASRDAGVGIASFAWDLNGDGVFDDAFGPLATRTFSDNTLLEVAVRVTDHLGHAATDRAEVTIENEPPAVQIAGHTPEQPWPGQTVTLEAIFVDPGWLDTHTATIEWGDGTTSIGTVTETNAPPQAQGTVHGQHQYTALGMYTVTVVVTDDDGGSGTASTEIVVELSPQMPGVFVPLDETVFHTWTGGFPNTLGDLRWMWRSGTGIARYWWIYEAQGWLYFFQVTPADWPQFRPQLAPHPFLNRLAIAVPREEFQRWFWCGVAERDTGFVNQGCHPVYGPPPVSEGALHPWVQQRIEESRQHVLNIVFNTFNQAGR